MAKNTNKTRTYQNIEFLVSIGEFKLRLSIPKHTTVGGIIAIIKGYEALHLQYGPYGTNFLGLASANLNPLLDYWLTQPHLDFTKFKKRIQLRSLYSWQRRSQKLCSGDFQFLVCLGAGACGAVYLVRNKVTGAVQALKRVSKSTIKDYQGLMTQFRQRKNLIRMGCNFHTVNMHACFQSKNHFNFLMDYYPGGELFLHLSKRNNLTTSQTKNYFCQILLAMEYIHKRKVLYRDLKPQNIFVDISGHLRIGDFGMSKSDFQQDDFADSVCGSAEYMAPEVLENQNYNFAADFYSIGAILYEFLTGMPPYYNQKRQNDEQKLFLMKNMSLDLSKATSDPHLQQLLVNLLHPNPDKRISNFQQIKNSPWLAGVDWKSLQLKQDMMPFAPDPSAPIQCYIGKQFLALQAQVHQINMHAEDQPFMSQISDAFQYIRPQSRKNLGLEFDSHLVKPKNKVSMKQKKEKLPKKANLSVALFDREQTICESVCSQPRTVKTTKAENKQNLGILQHVNSKKKVVVNLSKQGSTAFFGKTNNHHSQVSSTNRQKTQRSILTPVNHNSSEIGSKTELNSKTTSRGRQLFRGESRECKSKGKSKDKTLKESSLSKNGPMRRKQEKRVLPTCSFKIKLG